VPAVTTNAPDVAKAPDPEEAEATPKELAAAVAICCKLVPANPEQVGNQGYWLQNETTPALVKA
jgi:hypothetical protein